jgi:hypothetical protein
MAANGEGWAVPLLLALPVHRLTRRVLRLDPRLRRSAAIGRIRSLRHDALQPHAADMLEHGWAVTRQLSRADGRTTLERIGD